MAQTEKSIFQKINDIKLPGPARSPTIDSSLLSRFLFVRDILWLFLLIIPSVLLSFYEMIVPKAEKDVSGQVVVVTGAGNGMGRDIAIKFARLGSKVVCVDILKESNEETVEIIKNKFKIKTSVAMVCDVSDPDATRKLADDVVKKFGQVDILVHSAAIMALNKILGTPDSLIRKIMNVNLLGAFWMIRAFLPHMKKRRQGHIVMMNSGVNFFPLSCGTAYCSAKGGMKGLTDALTEELKESEDTKNIKITSIHPSFVNTFKQMSQVTNSRFNEKSSAFILGPREAARQIVQGIRREYDEFFIPGIRTGYPFLQCFRVLPNSWYHLVREVIYISPLIPNEKGYVAPTVGIPVTKCDENANM